MHPPIIEAILRSDYFEDKKQFLFKSPSLKVSLRIVGRSVQKLVF